MSHTVCGILVLNHITRFQHNMINMSGGAYKVAMGLNKGTIAEMDAHIGGARRWYKIKM